VSQLLLDWPDKHHLEATVGWLMLGNAHEARVEFEQISSAARLHLEVLDVEWRLLADEKRWEDAVGVAEAQILMSPQHVEGWIHRSFALHELRRTEAARELLLPAVKQFSKDTTIPYNLACYECQLGNLDAARDWLRRALARQKSADGRRQQLAMALTDPDLLPLADEIRRGDFDQHIA
jgi:Flp pilus assembly protein TadD